MSKLSPKPNPKYPDKKGWDDLNEWVQRIFRADRSSYNNKFGSIFLEDYSMPKSEIIIELERIGLRAKEETSGYLTVRE